MGAALDSFIDENGYRALDALNELRESYGFGHREGHMHGLRLAPVRGDAGEPTSPWAGTTTARRPGFEFGQLLAETSPRLTVTLTRVTRVAKGYLTMCSSKWRYLAGLNSAFFDLPLTEASAER